MLRLSSRFRARFTRASRSIVTLLALLSFACGEGASSSDELEESVSRKEANITDVHSRVFDFESVATDWRSSVNLGVTTDTSHGERALSFRPSYWTEVVSIPLSTLGEVEPEVTLHVALGSEMSWGDIRLVLNAPSAGIYYEQLGAHSVVGIPAGSYRPLRFTIPENVLPKLAQDYNDLTITIIFNTPPTTSPHHVDNLQFRPKSSTPPPPVEGTTYGSLYLELPEYAHPSRAALTALRELRVNDRARVETFNRQHYADAVNLGTFGTNLGVDSRLRNLTSAAPVTLRDRAYVVGDAFVDGPIHIGAGAKVWGTTKAIDVPTPTVVFTLNQAPTEVDVSSATNRNPAPGRYRHVRVDGASVVFRSGVYSLDTLYVSSQKNLLIDATDGPVVVLVSGAVDIHGAVQDHSGGLTPYPNWVLAYSGTSEVNMVHLDGAIFAPYAKVSTGSETRHEGTVIAKDIEVHQASVFAHAIRPSHWRELCKALGGRGGFCSPLPDAGEGCLFGVTPTFTGRDGYDPFSLLDERTVRGFVWVHDMHMKDLVHKEVENEIGIAASVWANIDSDPEQELIVGFTATGNDARRAKVFDDVKHGFRHLQDLFDGWGGQYGVTSMAAADIDGDGIDEIAVGRNSPSGSHEIEVLKAKSSARTACGGEPHVQLETIATLDIGDRRPTGLAFGDVDNDGSVDLVVTRTGRSDNQVPRLLVYRVGKFDKSQWQSNPDAHLSAANWAKELDATAVAIGDVQNDGIKEIAVGIDDTSGPRWELYSYSQTTEKLERIEWGGDSWGSNRRTTALAFGDVDGDGDDELIVGRDEGGNERAYLYDFDDNGKHRIMATFGQNWGNERQVTAVAMADVDGDGMKEILIGRSEGPGPRIYVQDGFDRGFELLRTEGDGWGEQRRVLTISASSRPYCLAYDPQPRPMNMTASTLLFPSRLESVIRTEVEAYLGHLKCEEDATKVFGRWRDDEDVQEAETALRRITAGYAALYYGQGDVGGDDAEGAEPPQPIMPGLSDLVEELTEWGFREKAGGYLANVSQIQNVGTHGDYDFKLMSLAGLLYRYRTTKIGNQFLLPDEAFEALRNSDCGPSSAPDQCPERSNASNFLYNFYSVGLPETENHVLMINTWHYLISQLDATESPREGQLEPSPFAALEERLLEVIARVVKNDMWETNAQAYEAFSVRPLQLLASYAVNPKMKIAAQNALDFIATKYTFQSLHGKRSAPMRRNWSYRGRYSLYGSDYLSGQFGVLSGDYVYPASCTGQDCVWTGDSQILSFALESGLAMYKLPHVLIEHMLHPDLGRPGYGSWARMQARYSEGDYSISQEPKYANAGSGSLEPAQEFYFRTAGYLNAAGGRHEPYSTTDIELDPLFTAAELALLSLPLPIDLLGLGPLQQIAAALGLYFSEDKIKNATEATRRGLDFVSKPTVLLGNADTRWGTLGTAENMTPLFRGNHGEFWHSNNTGVYKNFAVGYSTEREYAWLPPSFRVAAGEIVGNVRIQILDPESTLALFPNADYFVVFGQINEPAPGRASLGFYEVVPRAKGFNNVSALLALVLRQNASTWAGGDSYRYTTVTSGETIGINPNYPNGNPFWGMSGGAVANVHSADVSSGGALPLMDVQEVDDNLAFTGHRFACARGDGLLIVNGPPGGKRLVIDSRDPQNPKRCETQNVVPDDCSKLLQGLPVTIGECPAY